MLVKLVFTLALVAGASYAAWKYPEQVQEVLRLVTGSKAARPLPPTVHVPEGPRPPWDGLITMTTKAETSMGVQTVEVKAQTDPIRLELLGRTEYITDTMTKVRPMFKGRVDKVHVTVGQTVKKGDVLIDLYSTDLAEAKSAYDIERIQWIYDKKLLEAREALVGTKAISQQLFEETRNNEMKSRREYEVARDKLHVFGLSDEDVERVTEESGAQKARMTIRSPSDGFVIERDVVPGNLYDENDTLLVIAPLDRLWVWGNVFESDLDLVELGQSWEIRFPFLEKTLQGKVEYISNRVDPDTHAVRVRTSIPNPESRLKSDMLVRGMLEIPPAPGQTVIPRTALVVEEGRYYAFVRTGHEPDRFERREVGVAQEKDDHAVITHGVKAGEAVVSVGALILAQIYDDLRTSQTGGPVSPEGPGVD